MYIVIEGIDGCGKTSVIAELVRQLGKQNISPICVHEPTYGQFGLAARKLIAGNKMPPTNKLHALLINDRKDHVKTKIKPALKFITKNQKFCLLQDRGYLSAPAYQAKTDSDIFIMLTEQQGIAPTPDFFFLIDVDVAVALKRITERAGSASVFDRKKTLEHVRHRYLLLAKSGKCPVHIINGNASVENIANEILDYLDNHPT